VTTYNHTKEGQNPWKSGSIIGTQRGKEGKREKIGTVESFGNCYFIFWKVLCAHG